MHASGVLDLVLVVDAVDTVVLVVEMQVPHSTGHSACSAGDVPHWELAKARHAGGSRTPLQ